jgi:hypothetical protein
MVALPNGGAYRVTTASNRGSSALCSLPFAVLAPYSNRIKLIRPMMPFRPAFVKAPVDLPAAAAARP